MAEELTPGRYALAMRIATIAEAGWLPTVQSVSTSRVMVDLSFEGGVWSQTARVCAVDIEGTSLAKITVPARFVAAMPVKQMRPRVEAGRFYVDMGVDRVGYVGEAIPTVAAGAVDWDQDGHPGATVDVKVAVLGGGNLYVAQTAWLVLDGVIKDGGAEGWLDIRSFDQRTIGAEPGWLAIDTRLTANAAKSSFRLVPVTADASCEAVVAATRR